MKVCGWCLFVALGFAAQWTAAGEISDLGRVAFQGKIAEDKDLSGAATFGTMLVIGSDERSAIQILRREAPDRYQLEDTIQLLSNKKSEADIEAIAVSGDALYVAGSHSHVRSKVEPSLEDNDRNYEKNRERLGEIKREASRDLIYRLRLSATGVLPTAIAARNLRPLIADDPILGPFTKVPGKEGGIDIEGLAADGEELYVGFRGPVLRQNYVPVIRFRFDDESQYELLFVNLEGYGIRDLLKVSGGFLVLAGPLGDRKEDCELYFWDGSDCVPGQDRAPARLVRLGKLPAPDGGKAEAMAQLGETADAWEILTLYDSADDGAPRRWRVGKPR